MNLRKTRAAEAADDARDEADLEAEVAVAAGTKGRPTPKRRESEGPRGPVSAPKTRKEALARQRELSKVAKTRPSTTGNASKLTVAQRREAIKRGDPQFMARRDQGKSRKLARDYVDSHRLVSNYMLWLFPIMIAGALIPLLSLITLVIFFALLLEWYVIGKRIRAMAIDRYGKAEGGAMTLGFYAGSRAYLPRRWRLPAPQVVRGDEI